MIVLLALLFLQGTNIAAGKCRGIVVGTGLETEIGVFPFHMLVIFGTMLFIHWRHKYTCFPLLMVWH